MLGGVPEHAAGQVEVGYPEPHAATRRVCGRPVGLEQGDGPTASELEPLARAGGEERDGALGRETTQLDHPLPLGAAWHRSGEVELDRLSEPATPALAHGIERRIDGRAGVHDDDIARAQVVRQMAEARVGDQLAPASAHEQAHAVAGEPARLRWLMRRRDLRGLGPLLQHCRRAHAASACAAASAAAE